MDLKLKGKVAVVLASSGGIGRGVATVLAQEGCSVAICSRNDAKLARTANEIKKETQSKVCYQNTDVSNAQSLNKFFDHVYQQFGRVDILVNNAGGPPAGTSDSFEDKDYLSAFELSLMSVIRSCRRVLPGMRDQKSGKIITITSTSVKCAMHNMVLSNTFRSAAAAFSKSISLEAGPDGVRVHTVMPGPFLTDRVSELGTVAAREQGISFDEWKTMAENNTPLKRFGSPEEIGQLVAFLVSDLSEYMNGTCIAMDGGILTTIS